MKRRLLNQIKIDAYKNFIKMQYGEDAYNKLEIAIKSDITDKDFEVRSKDFDKKLEEVAEIMEN